MVRVMTPVGRSEQEALAAAADLSKQVALALPAYVPD
jgi:hypothetical protein